MANHCARQAIRVSAHAAYCRGVPSAGSISLPFRSKWHLVAKGHARTFCSPVSSMFGISPLARSDHVPDSVWVFFPCSMSKIGPWRDLGILFSEIKVVFYCLSLRNVLPSRADGVMPISCRHQSKEHVWCQWLERSMQLHRFPPFN